MVGKIRGPIVSRRQLPQRRRRIQIARTLDSAGHTLSAASWNEQCAWIVDSGATCHMCQDSKSFTTLSQLVDVVFGDGQAVTAVGMLDMVFPNGESKPCTLMSSTYPRFHNLISVAKLLRRARL